ncbi:MAG: alpha/beta fold hydrolase [Balneolaceae bacterium]|jgi:pimeloyl-ACP methyl ester carboxylesterase/DNA-binding CsgD family transcriptional regulator
MTDPHQHIRFCTAPDGVQIAYSTSGDGPPIVRVANWLTHLDMDWKSAIWSHWFQEFSHDHTLVRYDMRGSGLSDRNVKEQSIEVWVRDLHSVIIDLDLDQFILLGHCQGGAISIAYAACFPERVKKLILFDTYTCGALVHGAPKKQKHEAQALAQMIEVGWGHEATAFRKVFADLLMPEASDEHRNWLAELQRKSVSPKMASRLWTAFHEIDVREQAKQIEVPTIIFHVTGDRLVPFEEGRKLAGLIDHARFIPLEGNNHILLENEPAWEKFLDQARDFAGIPDSPLEEPLKHGEEFEELTSREQEVLDLLARGLNNKQIADLLFISPKTVRNHIYRIFSKLQVKSRAKAIIKARDAGMGKNGVTSD